MNGLERNLWYLVWEFSCEGGSGEGATERVRKKGKKGEREGVRRDRGDGVGGEEMKVGEQTTPTLSQTSIVTYVLVT